MTMKQIGELVSESGDRYLPEIYHDETVYEREMDAIFGRCWQFVGHVSQIRERGDYFLSRMGEERVIVTRGNDGDVHVMLNMCRHRGHVLCRTERGNAKRFVCPFHAWTYSADGDLLNAPLAQELAPDMPKGDFGLVQVPRVDVYHGLIFASFDENAPPLIDELGDLAFYLEMFLGRRDVELEMIGGIQKWEVDANWKIGPDGMGGDFYHTPAAHASVFAANPALRDSINGMMNPQSARNIAFDGGHGFNMLFLPEGLPDDYYFPIEPRFLEVPEVRAYFTGIQAEARARLGPRRTSLKITTGTIFPNLSFSPGIFTLRLVLPKGPGRIENWCWVFGYSDMPPVVKAVMHQAYLSVFGPDGCLEADDAEAWTLVTDGTRSRQGRKVPLFAGLGADNRDQDPDLPGYHHHPMSEGVSRAFLRQWRKRMLEAGA
ncbi:putative naphthalene dioxygenase large subunit [Caenibius tardaugens NBRC 16725]|uniref:Putative naphthalene dioxygenase large subunit n=1 Tax=Caenibius tardaugens NBRC 16725 TaxID=1219035 RepID=U2ZZ25_9SPHN|nr:Rieske 2Fe-2S domain-containing protein [Caenibius tardaugens]AZI37011.1 hypothetical protein EGO55_14435 [Caenibius tardaugens NBRC 16725]GAD47768.1 putative naphthalene dioxygenase large subunit [Caenibius tardaugens NBRC 16725]